MKTIEIIDVMNVMNVMNVGDMTIFFDEKSNQCYSTPLTEDLYIDVLVSNFWTFDDFFFFEKEIYIQMKDELKSEFDQTFDEYAGVAVVKRNYDEVIYREFYLVY